MIDRDRRVCGEPVLVGKVCYDHAVMHPLTGEPMCTITCSDADFDRYNDERRRQGQAPRPRTRR
jgi:hypothetical protein